MPEPTRGTRTRSGNAMLRTRAAILDAAEHCVQRGGVKRTTMSAISSRAGVAKATLYNHFRTKDDVLVALVEARVSELGQRAEDVVAGRVHAVAGQPSPACALTAALVQAGTRLAASPALRRLAAEEPAVLMRLAAPGGQDGWAVARAAVGQVLQVADLEVTETSTELVLRYLVHSMIWPAGTDQMQAGAALLVSGLASSAQARVPVTEPAGSSLGWPPGTPTGHASS